jgi:dihydroorotate dehydrogenase (NAD+) catalytic subunit
VLEFLIAGARAVQIGTANFADPGVYERVRAGLVDYMTRHGVSDINALVGTLEYPGARPSTPPPEAGSEG